MPLGDSRPVMNTRPAQRIDAEMDLRTANDVQIDDMAEIVYVGGEEVVPVRGRGVQSSLVETRFIPLS